MLSYLLFRISYFVFHAIQRPSLYPVISNYVIVNCEFPFRSYEFSVDISYLLYRSSYFVFRITYLLCRIYYVLLWYYVVCINTK